MKTLKTVFLLSAISLATGCTISGHPDFTCPDPENGVCTDAHTAFILAENGKSAADYTNNSHIGHKNGSADGYKDEDGDHTNHDHSDRSGSVNTAKDGKQSPYRDVAPIAGLMRMPVDQPKPVLMQATVLEGWVNVWEDQNGSLRMPSTILVEITPRRWNLEGTNIEEFKTQGPFVTTTAVE